MSESNLLCISTGDFIRPDNVSAVTAEDKEDKWSEPRITIYISDNVCISTNCDTFEDAQNLRDEIAAAIISYL